jgi:UDP-glucose 4-epimerase
VILVTGGTGFIGSSVVARLVAAGRPVVRGGPPPELGLPPVPDDGGPAAVPVDVTDVDALVDVVRGAGVDSIVHLAAPSIADLGSGPDLLGPSTAMLAVLAAARRTGVGRVTVASSLEVYAGLPTGPCTEDDPLPVASPTALAAAKKSAEVLGDVAARAAGIDLVSLRLGFVYGPGYRSMINFPSQVAHAVARGRSLGEQPPGRLGTALDLVHVADCAAAVVAVATAAHRPHRVYNVGTGRLTTPAEVAAAAGLDLPPEPRPGTVADQTPVMDVARIRADLGVVATHDIGSGMRDYLAWLAEHEY